MKIPFPPSSPDPGADGMLMGGICQLVVFPSTGTLSAPAPAAQGASSTPGTGWVLPPCCSSAPHATSFLPNVVLISSSSLVCARLLAGSCVPLGEGMGPGLEVCRTWVSFATQGKEG